MCSTPHSGAFLTLSALPAIRPSPILQPSLRQHRYARYTHRTKPFARSAASPSPFVLCSASGGNGASQPPPSAPFSSDNTRRGIRPKQSLGQNFLRDNNVITRIVNAFRQTHADISPDSRVVEVGPGLGALTTPLLEHFPGMHVIEIDQRAIVELRTMHPSLSIEHGDVLDANWVSLSSRLQAPLAVIGNLPYNIVSQILLSLLETPPGYVRFAVVMMQREVALRITAGTRCKAYGILSVISQLYSRPSVRFNVSPRAFYPVPDVTSCIVSFEFKPCEGFDGSNALLRRALKRVLKAAFGQRRKVLRNALKALCDELKVELPEELEERRAEELTPLEFVELTKIMFKDEFASGDGEGGDGDVGPIRR